MAYQEFKTQSQTIYSQSPIPSPVESIRGTHTTKKILESVVTSSAKTQLKLTPELNRDTHFEADVTLPKMKHVSGDEGVAFCTGINIGMNLPALNQMYVRTSTVASDKTRLFTTAAWNNMPLAQIVDSIDISMKEQRTNLFSVHGDTPHARKSALALMHKISGVGVKNGDFEKFGDAVEFSSRPQSIRLPVPVDSFVLAQNDVFRVSVDLKKVRECALLFAGHVAPDSGETQYAYVPETSADSFATGLGNILMPIKETSRTYPNAVTRKGTIVELCHVDAPVEVFVEFEFSVFAYPTRIERSLVTYYWRDEFHVTRAPISNASFSESAGHTVSFKINSENNGILKHVYVFGSDPRTRENCYGLSYVASGHGLLSSDITAAGGKNALVGDETMAKSIKNEFDFTTVVPVVPGGSGSTNGLRDFIASSNIVARFPVVESINLLRVNDRERMPLVNEVFPGVHFLDFSVHPRGGVSALENVSEVYLEATISPAAAKRSTVFREPTSAGESLSSVSLASDVQGYDLYASEKTVEVYLVRQVQYPMKVSFRESGIVHEEIAVSSGF